jgi:hypothetical protein
VTDSGEGEFLSSCSLIDGTTEQTATERKIAVQCECTTVHLELNLGITMGELVPAGSLNERPTR